jgi:RNA-directed DNA polymerase
MVDRLNRQMAGWAAFYKFTDFTARVFRHIDHVVFWKMAHWLAQKYRSTITAARRTDCRYEARTSASALRALSTSASTLPKSNSLQRRAPVGFGPGRAT